MRRHALLFIVAAGLLTSAGQAFQAGADGPYKVLQTAKVGGEGGTDYIFADAVGRRLYITRNAAAARPATDTTPAVPAAEGRLTIFNLDTLEPAGVIPGIAGNGATVCPKTGHGFTSDHPQPSMFDAKTMKLIKKIEIPAPEPPATPDGQPVRWSADGIYCDTSNDRVYIGSHPTKSLLVVDAKDGTVLGNIALGGTPEQTIGDGKGTIYQVLQERPGGVAVIDVKTMKVTKTYPLGDNGSCNGLNLDVKNQILFAACAAVGPAPARGGGPGAAVPPAPAPAAAGAPPAQGPQAMVILSARDGKILARLPLAGSSDGVAFNPATLEAFSTQGNGTMTIVKEKSPTSFVVEQNLKTWPSGGARTVAFDSKTGHLFAMASEALPPPPPPPPPPPGTQGTPPPAGGRGGGRGSVPGSFTIIMVGIK
jgi:DNA-binding beta-propeller fold protein YncE